MQIYERPFVTSIKPVIIVADKKLGIPKILKIFAVIWIILLVCNIEIMIEDSTTNPPITKIVLIEVVILLEMISPRFEIDKFVSKEYSVLLRFFSLFFPHHLKRKPTVSELKMCVIKRINPTEGLKNNPNANCTNNK